MNRKQFVLGLTGAAVLGLWAAHAFWPVARSRPAVITVPGRNVLLGMNARLDDLTVLHTLQWVDVTPTFEAVMVDAYVRDRLAQDRSVYPESPPAYLRALLRMASNDLTGAREGFRQIPVGDIPALLLYAPYRLHQQLAPGEGNPYREALRGAVRAEQVPPLISARVLATEGELGAALTAYLKTDPAAWAGYDLQNFRLLRIHEGYAPEIATLLLAAQKGGRLAEPLRAPVARLLLEPAAGLLPGGEIRPRLAQALREQPALGQVMTQAAARQLQMRQKFLSRDYAGLLADHAAAPPESVGDETVLLLVLAAASEREAKAWAVWSQELRRRYRDPEVEKWLRTLQNQAR